MIVVLQIHLVAMIKDIFFLLVLNAFGQLSVLDDYTVFYPYEM